MKCNGKNCKSTNGYGHSFECRREHDEAIKSGIKRASIICVPDKQAISNRHAELHNFGGAK
jgi:hypothetical protein